MHTRSNRRTLVALAIALVVTGCTSVDSNSDLPEVVVADKAVGTTPFVEPTDQLTWVECGDLQCSEVLVPLDHADPDGATLSVAVARRRATSDKIGSLLINPGGPGASGIEYLEFFASVAPGELKGRFDLVSFDPRGVGRSGSIDCGWIIDDDTFDPARATGDLPTQVSLSIDEALADADACRRNVGDLLDKVSTATTARDLDVIRAALDDDELTYLGFSYGTLIGAVYAELFPDRVRAMVLDGADKLEPAPDDILSQYLSFESAFDAFDEGCGAREECPLEPGEAHTLVAEIDGLLREEGLSAGDGRLLTRDELPVALLSSLYDQNSWTRLAAGLGLAAGGDGTSLQRLVDGYAGRRSDGSYSDIFESFTAITCGDDDFRPQPADVLQLAQRAEAELDAFASVAGAIGVGCLGWAAPTDPLPEPIQAIGAPTLLVVGTTGDPATPYEWAEQMADALDSGVLLTYEGVVHTAFNTSDCVRDAAVDYLIDLVVPTSLTCKD